MFLGSGFFYSVWEELELNFKIANPLLLHTKNEQKRLNDLKLYKIMDTSLEKSFDDLTKLASIICQSPICLISLVDERRQWFKSHYGIESRETPREQAFCAHTILDDEIMIVPDAQLDERFLDNPLVTGEPKIRFYAGAPLTVQSGSCLGTLCIIDRKPRELSQIQKESLSVLRDTVVNLLELRRANNDLEALQDIVPMCAWCHKIQHRNKDASVVTWQPLHEYVADQNPVSHGICPDCSSSMKEDHATEYK